MIFFFLSVAAVCVTALCGFRMFLKAHPVQAAEFAALKATVEKLENGVRKLSMGKIGG